MPFQITTQPFGPLPTGSAPLTEYVLEHTETGEFITVIPEFGAILRRLVLRKGRHLFALIQAPESPQALLADESYASAFLYPFVSRIRHGVYQFDGTDYAVKMNEVYRDNAIHGFVHGRPFTVVNQEVTSTHAQLVLRYSYEGDTFGYPFPFVLTVTYQLTQANRLMHGSNPADDRMCALKISYTAQNTGTTRAPAAFGWHPYFTFTEDAARTAEFVDGMTLALPGRTAIVLDDHMIPVSKYPFQPAEIIELHKRQLDTPFLVTPTSLPTDNESFAETILTSGETGARLIVGQQTGEGKLNYLVCYTPPRRDSIAIEPQTANVNAFNNGEGLAILAPGDSLSGIIWVRLD
ncbi:MULTISPECIES: aldose 1-epimerase [unclassified Spirosoma]|uniref:aldose 1-epimerase n=1 Tax=unclassified Spirosoma TaxID=2621999 RepID=UPI00095A78B0|nr:MULTISPECIES: aldose 1-epimerase [unclassified Spirosoma]MBN8826078.1 aldose 1-epimerase [Spirosoma sp.]OJW75529.1 MAG: aldose epimerase [Spirosoma sp. 48-14]